MKYGKIEALAETLNEVLTPAQLVRLWNEMIETEMSDGTLNERYILDMDDFNDEFSGMTPFGIAMLITDSKDNFDAYNQWFCRFYGSTLKSFSSVASANCPIDTIELAYWLLSENGKDYANDIELEAGLEKRLLNNVVNNAVNALEAYKEKHEGLNIMEADWDELTKELLERCTFGENGVS